MEDRIITKSHIQQFSEYLQLNEKSPATVEKYMRDVRAFQKYVMDCDLSKNLLIEYKHQCMEQGFAVRSINSMLASINSFLTFMGWNDCKVKSIRLQQQAYSTEESELTKAEYFRLLDASKGKEQLNLILKTICGTGIRVSELKYFTVETVKCGAINISCKNKTRTILIPAKLKKLLLSYAKKHDFQTGVIFRGRDGKPMDRSCIWRQMKALCKEASVAASKVFPHNLRKLFARTFYGIEKDIAKLADVLGHTSIDTTRIYIKTTAAEHLRQINLLGLVL